MKLLLATAVIMTMATACAHVKPYEKEHLLHPLMDDSALQSLTLDYSATATADYERLSGGPGSGGATSCPTCGG